MTSIEALREAKRRMEVKFIDNPATLAHRVFIGPRKRGGKYLFDEPNVVCVVVPKKLPVSALSKAEVLPMFAIGMREHVPIDVQEEPFPETLILPINHVTGYSGTPHQGCFGPTVPGGAQIQPRGANWVGTLGCMVRGPDGRIYAITNAHVTGFTAQSGTDMFQPDGRNSIPFAKIHKVIPVDVSRTATNVVDLAILRCEQDGKHTCSTGQIGITKPLGTKMVTAVTGMDVTKSGRTTGVTVGRCVGIEGVSLVGYSGGTAKFVDQDYFAREDGLVFSAAGDSGSAILETGTNNLVALLFAGGGGQTIGNPSRHLAEVAGLSMYHG